MACQHRADWVFRRFQTLRQTQPEVEPLAVDGTHLPDNAHVSAVHGVLHGVACKSGHALERHAFHPLNSCPQRCGLTQKPNRSRHLPPASVKTNSPEAALLSRALIWNVAAIPLLFHGAPLANIGVVLLQRL